MNRSSQRPGRSKRTFTRRQWIQTASSATLLGACEIRETIQPPDARFVGQDPKVAHRVRRPLESTIIEASLRTRVLIVGAGAAGLSLAWALRRSGIQDFVIVDLEGESGGTARGGRIDSQAYPFGAHYLPRPSARLPELESLLDDIGWITGRQADGEAIYRASLVCPTPIERHFYRGFWYEGLYPKSGETRDERQQFERFNAYLLELDARKDFQGRPLFQIPATNSDVSLHGLDHISATDHLRAMGFDSWRLHWWIDYACRDDFGLRASQCSAFAALHHFLARGHESTRDDALLTSPGGNSRLLHDLRSYLKINERLQLHTLIRSIDATNGQAIAENLQTGQLTAIRADQIFWAAPRFILNAVASGGPNASAPDMTPWLCASLQLRHLPAGPGAALAWDNVSVDADHLGYVVANHGVSRPDAERDGIITYYEALFGNNRTELQQQRAWLASQTPEELAARSIDAIARLHPGLQREVVRVDIARWGHAMVRPVPGAIFGSAAKDARMGWGKVIPGAVDIRGIPIFEEAFYGALQIVDRWLHTAQL